MSGGITHRDSTQTVSFSVRLFPHFSLQLFCYKDHVIFWSQVATPSTVTIAGNKLKSR